MRTVLLYHTELDTDSYAAQHAAGRALLRQALAAAGLSPDLPVCTDAQGKPVLPDAPGFCFSIAHCRNRVICAVSDRPIGCDLERERTLKRELAPRICTPHERAILRTNADLFQIWVGKEAVLKAAGMGLRRPLGALEVGLDDRCTVNLDGAPYTLRRVPQADGWHLAVCLAGAQDFIVRRIPTIA